MTDEFELVNYQTDEIVKLIQQLAYQKWEAAGGPAGEGTEIWLEAEQEIKLD